LGIDQEHTDAINPIALEIPEVFRAKSKKIFSGLAKTFFMVYRENIGQLKHLPFL
jgi:hypothetical protein